MNINNLFLLAIQACIAALDERLIDGTRYTLEDRTDPHAYCQASYPTLATYTPQENATLVSVHLLTRHGDRVPVDLSTDLTAWRCQTIYAAKSRTGYFLVVEKRRAEESKCIFGQLTSKGVDQMMGLGGNLHDIYKDFINNKASVKIRSTEAGRCILSTVALMSKLLPQETEFEILNLPKKIDGLIYYYNDCPNQQKIVDAIGRSKADSKLNDWFYHRFPKYKNVSSTHPEYKLLTQPDLDKCHFCHGAGDNDTMESIFSASNARYRHLFFDDANITPALYRMRIGSVLLDIKQNLLRAGLASLDNVIGSTTNQFHYYSTHDCTLAALLSSLSIRETKVPPYAANLLIELWAPSPRSFNTLTLRFIYNGNQVFASWCRSQCSLKAFLDHLDNALELFGGFEPYFDPPKPPFNLTQECHI
ncbi:hypothetical protein DSO57_1004417 [Entomophthora muscae]|uniref:Uncharacterized protein n=2 Tax=Entomophthora muscae TaxID=34485 RepID=A0ACC2TJ54_9FUNG|nr:hypothetical protein DSO57_1004417 [Entomophthora muscae]